MKIELTLNDKSINQAIKELEKYKRDLDNKARIVVERLASLGATNASLGFARAVTTENDVQVTVEWVDSNTMRIRATGEEVLFIEFGTGITYGYGHPMAQELGYGAGTYPSDKGNWDNPNGWWYSKDGNPKHTYGNPPNAVMYNTMKMVEREAERVVREVFG